MQAVNLALNAGRKLQKPQTGFVHYCAQSEDGFAHDTIPILENALFALSLFRSRQADNVLEGKSLLENLLAFEISGTFPAYLHRYPHGDDPFLPLRLLPIFYWVLAEFPHVLGTLKASLQGSFERLLAYAKDHPLPSWGRMRLDAFEGKVTEGLEPWTASEGLISLQIAEKNGANIEPFIHKACALWHPELQLYIGPAKQRATYQRAPVVTLFDLYMAQWQHQFSQRLLDLQPVHLQAALIRPLGFEVEFPKQRVPHVHFHTEESFPLWMAWDDHSLVLSPQPSAYVERKAGEVLIFLQEADEVSFFVDYHPDHSFFVNGQRATAFRSGDCLEMRSKGLTLTLSFTSEEGVYFGHLLRGNRPHQHGCKGQRRFASYDWQIALRAVKKAAAPIRVRLQIASQEPQSQQPLPWHASHYPHTP